MADRPRGGPTILDYADQVWRREIRAADVPYGDLRARGAQRVADGMVVWPSFGNVYAVDSGDGLVLFDTGNATDTPAMYRAIRDWSWAPVRYAVFSHGHVDHVAGMEPFDDEDGPRIMVVAHENAAARFARHARAAGYNTVVGQRQFGFTRLTWPSAFRSADLTYRDRFTVSLGDVTFDLRHARGETDDATWAFVAERGVLFTGDLFVWATPNAGSPHKTQCYPDDWAVALRRMAALDAEVLLPGQGPPIVGADRVRRALTDTADYLDALVGRTLELMNAGARLDEIVHRVRPPDELARLPYLRPRHDEAEFVIHNVWRLYGGWYDGNPAHLKPAPDAVFARSLAGLAGGTAAIAGGGGRGGGRGGPAAGLPARRAGGPGRARRRRGARDPGPGVRRAGPPGAVVDVARRVPVGRRRVPQQGHRGRPARRLPRDQRRSSVVAVRGSDRHLGTRQAPAQRGQNSSEQPRAAQNSTDMNVSTSVKPTRL